MPDRTSSGIRRLLQVLPLFGLILSGQRASAEEYSIAPPSNWVVPLAIPFDAKPAEDEISSGAHWLAIDRQIRVAPGSQESYTSHAIRLLNENGVEDNANISIDFDPSYQTPTLHEVRLLRGPASIDPLKRARISVLRRETQFEWRIYDGSLTPEMILDDVRVGDVVPSAVWTAYFLQSRRVKATFTRTLEPAIAATPIPVQSDPLSRPESLTADPGGAVLRFTRIARACIMGATKTSGFT